MIDLQSPQIFQIQVLYSIFHVPSQQQEPINLEKNMENLIQSQNDFTQSINRLEAQIIYLVNTINDKNEETSPTQFLTIPDFPSHIDRNKESSCFENFNLDSISSQHLELDKYQIIDKLTSFHFNEIEL